MVEFIEYLNGNKLYGDDFSEKEIVQWFDYEKEAYADLYENPSENNTYYYNTLNILQGFRYLPKDKKYPKVLGFGSAYGNEFLPISKQIGELFILEPSDTLVAKNIFDIPSRYIKPQLNGKLDFPDDYFDLIICFGTLHHIANISSVFSEMARTLNKGGYMLIREPIISMGDWRNPRKGLTKCERGIPLSIFRGIIKKNSIQIVKENLFLSMTFFLGRVLKNWVKKPIYTYQTYLQIDRFLSWILAWNQTYHAKSIWERMAPTNVFYVLKK